MDDRVPEHRDSHACSSHELSLEPTKSVDWGKHSVYTHFPNRPKLRDLPEDQNNKGPVQKTYCQSRTGCVSWDAESPESSAILRKGTKVLGPIRRVRFIRTVLRQANIRENEGPWLNKIQVKLLHQRSPFAVKCEDRAQEETERQERCARETRGELQIIFTCSKKWTQLHSIRLPMSGVAGRTTKQEEREFLVDPGASMQIP